MKDFMKKKMYLILLVVSFSTLFSAILYADPIDCENDSDCPQGMICVIPGNICMVPAIITCTAEPLMVDEISYCYIEKWYWGNPPQTPTAFVDCIPTGSQSDMCIMRMVP